MIALARLSENEKAQEVARRWNALPRKDRSHTSLDELCGAADVTPSKLLGVVVATAHELGMDVGGVLRAIANFDTIPPHMDRVVKRGGFKDRARILESVGLYSQSDGPRADQLPSEIESLESFEADTIQYTRLLKGWRR